MSAPPAKRTRFTDSLRALSQAADAKEERRRLAEKQKLEERARAACALIDALFARGSKFVDAIEEKCKRAANARWKNMSFVLVFKDARVVLYSSSVDDESFDDVREDLEYPVVLNETIRACVEKALRDALEDDSIAVSRKSGDELKIAVSFN